ncbi:MAG: hypothetical protein L0229_21395 [Blastocatellia bacterium]|nr:hypothetical protein [Blastocatellia bacterium]
MTGSRPDNLEEYKIKAAILLKLLRSTDPQKSLDAATRFQCLPHLSGLSLDEIVLRKEGLKLKDALTVIALERGYASWPDLKRRMEKRDRLRSKRAYTPLYPKRCAGFLNEWYASYEAARSHLEQAGGYLLPYKNHFFLCKRGYIEALGLDPDDEDWERIGWDWAKPRDLAAWERLNSRLQSLEADHAE